MITKSLVQDREPFVQGNGVRQLACSGLSVGQL